MAVTTPAPVSIIANIATAFAAITTTASYRNTIAKVDTQFLAPEKLGGGSLLPALLVYGDVIEYETAGVGNPPLHLGTLHLKVQGILKHYSTPATELHELVQDVREKLFSDRTRGGYANNTRITRVELGGEPFGGKFGEPPFVAKPFVGFLMDVEVDFEESV